MSVFQHIATTESPPFVTNLEDEEEEDNEASQSVSLTKKKKSLVLCPILGSVRACVFVCSLVALFVFVRERKERRESFIDSSSSSSSSVARPKSVCQPLSVLLAVEVPLFTQIGSAFWSRFFDRP